MDYVMTEQMIADYRRVVDNPRAAYPTVAARHPANLFYRKYRQQLRVPNTGHDSEYFNPPIAGKRITVSARIVAKYIRRDKPYLVSEARAVDSDGRSEERRDGTECVSTCRYRMSPCHSNKHHNTIKYAHT